MTDHPTEQVDRTLQELSERHRAEPWPDGTGSNCTECNGRRFPCPTRQGLDRLRAALDAYIPPTFTQEIRHSEEYRDYLRVPVTEVRLVGPWQRVGSVGERVWIDYDDGHAGGYPHWCERPVGGRDR